MDYQYEQLGDERFQELCQALLVKELPHVQCFPVGQPDGGRDAIGYFVFDKSKTGFSVFQIKYVRKPLAEKDPHKRILEIIEEEAPKLHKLIPKGAKSYYLITNVPGTAHLDVGAIDKCQTLLSNALSVPAFCWWRDDLNRHLDNAYDLKWIYPELMTGTDLLRLIVESGLTEDKERRTSAIRTFVRTQYNEDEEVRFKQIELQNKLLDLFIDVPIGSDDRRYQPLLSRLKGQRGVAGEEELGAARVLLDQDLQRFFPQVILEGAPGQGKSTLAQFICQVHRMRILEEHAVLDSVPKEYVPSAVKIPFKVDLRDLALWLNKRDPFSSEESHEVPEHWAKSLEAFLAALVRHQSGGAAFSVTDLHAVVRLSAILLVLDGLDEVADLSERKEVVSAIVSGVSRLKELAASIQVLVTSRPTAFAVSLGFPEKTFPHFHLLSLTKTLISDYAEKWIKARRLSEKDASDVRRTLRQKIEQPHLRDLARNPMQLAILLSLIHSKGPSLPDKRTALYDKYVDRFFSREAEKSELVRDNSDTLIDLHRYLAWVLHYEAEKGLHRGSIGSERLQQLLSDYLASEGRDVSLVTDLFRGVVERIFFIVSRVEGTFEFEVQPLREYFAARHLYETAPYSPTGSERKGTKPDRFDGIVQSPYWLNVTRFFAGCFSKGELASLVDRLHALAEKDGYRHTNYPKRVAATLLGDWVFSQDQRSTQEAVEFVLDDIGLRHPLVRRRRPRGIRFRGSITGFADDTFLLPKGCGREELVDRCFSLLSKKLPGDYSIEIAQLLRANSNSGELEPRWYEELKKSSGLDLTNWLRNGLYLGTLPNCPVSKLEEALSGKSLDTDKLDLLLSAGHAPFIEASEERTINIINGILDGTVALNQRKGDLLSRFRLALEPRRYSFALQNPAPISLKELLRGSPFGHTWEKEEPLAQLSIEGKNDSLLKCFEIVKIADEEMGRTAMEWASELTCWDKIVEISRSLWGERWIHFGLANVAAGIKSDEVTCKDYQDLLDHEKSLCCRVRQARLKAGAHRWWQSQFENTRTKMDRLLVALVFHSWASIGTKVKLLDNIQDALDKLSSAEWKLLSGALKAPNLYMRSRQSRSIQIDELPENLSPRVVAALGFNFAGEQAAELFTTYLSDYDGEDEAVLDFCERSILHLARRDPQMWKPALRYIEKRYAVSETSDSYWRYIRRENGDSPLPLEVAKYLAQNPGKYPRDLVYYAEELCEYEIVNKLKPVGDIAEREGWFERTTKQRKRQ